MLSIAVVDDEQAFSDALCRMIRQFAAKENVEVEITCFRDGLDIADEFRSRWDIIFLDIQMEHLDGLAVARRIRACDTDVVLIFVTTMAQYAINGYEVDAFDYILKPLSYPQFELRMLKAVKEVEKKAHSYVYLKKYSDVVKVSTDDILYIEVAGHTLRYVTDGETYERRATIGDAEKELAGLPFARCSLSFLVNLKRIDRVSGDTVLIGPHQLPLSRNRKKEFLQAFSDFLEAGF
ncbi:MAG: response regulator transcription factor [Clostridia bacterium]|nr:response regulator transcription factor [Clostridia bacterium]